MLGFVSIKEVKAKSRFTQFWVVSTEKSTDKRSPTVICSDKLRVPVHPETVSAVRVMSYSPMEYVCSGGFSPEKEFPLPKSHFALRFGLLAVKFMILALNQ